VTHPIAFDTLVAYWLGETDEATTHAIDEHLLGCDRCGAQLDEVIALGDGVRRAFDAGLVAAFVGAPFIERLAARGAHVHEYRLAPGESVACHAAPGDDVLVTRLAAPLAGVARVDAVIESSLVAGEQRLADIPFDAARGQVLLMPRIADVRPERVLGRYTLDHSPA